MGDVEDKNSSGVAIVAVFCLNMSKMCATCNHVGKKVLRSCSLGAKG